eukprot:CAMPEP_0204345568 /NCGR_PEP_ID=MMETSP0469-20131031/26498_1 /ASSEMBLY_ACC=CAM_ASM_000384 /TAXON_ID=2969 /ORGANISM="Oxyrrhis marina" /LENGTH=51 /DNA_ID=CAMNT_0051331025 /DNA_START=122 /DNA_END=274 /DNA_ORIENTATION=+
MRPGAVRPVRSVGLMAIGMGVLAVPRAVGPGVGVVAIPRAAVRIVPPVARR